MKYLKSELTGKIYEEKTLATVHSVDPNHFDTDMQNCDDAVVLLQKQITDKQTEKATLLQTKIDFFNQFPEITPAIPLP